MIDAGGKTYLPPSKNGRSCLSGIEGDEVRVRVDNRTGNWRVEKEIMEVEVVSEMRGARRLMRRFLREVFIRA